MTALINYADLAVYLNDPSIDVERAEAMIDDAQTLCESVLTPLPAEASVVVKRVAGRAYVSTMTTRTAQMYAAGSQIGAMPLGMGGIFLTKQDRADLYRLNDGSSAFTINPLPTDYTITLPAWDVSGIVPTIESS